MSLLAIAIVLEYTYYSYSTSTRCVPTMVVLEGTTKVRTWYHVCMYVRTRVHVRGLVVLSTKHGS